MFHKFARILFLKTIKFSSHNTKYSKQTVFHFYAGCIMNYLVKFFNLKEYAESNSIQHILRHNFFCISFQNVDYHFDFQRNETFLEGVRPKTVSK